MAMQVSMKIVAMDGANNVVETNIGYVNPVLADGTEEHYNILDQAARKLNGLTTNTYYDALLIRTNSLKEELE